MGSFLRPEDAAAWTQAGYTLGGMLKARQQRNEYSEFLDNEYEELKAKIGELNQRRAELDLSKETDELANITNELKTTVNDWVLNLNLKYTGNPLVNNAVQKTFDYMIGPEGFGSFAQAETHAADINLKQQQQELTEAQAFRERAHGRNLQAQARETGRKSRPQRLSPLDIAKIQKAEAQAREAISRGNWYDRRDTQTGSEPKLTSSQIANNLSVTNSRSVISGMLSQIGGLEDLTKRTRTASELGLGSNPDFSPAIRNMLLKAANPLKGVPDPGHKDMLLALSGFYHPTGELKEKRIASQGGVMAKNWLEAASIQAATGEQLLEPGHFYELKFNESTNAVLLWNGKDWETPEWKE